MKQTERLMLRLNPEFKERLQTAADQEGISMSEYLVKAADEKMAVHTKKDEVIKELKAVHTDNSADKPPVHTKSQTDFERFKRFRKIPYTQY